MASSVTLHIDQGALARMLKSSGGPVGRHIVNLANRTLDKARQNAPVKSGALKASLGIIEVSQVQRGTMVRLGANISYGLAVHEGTPSRTILPNQAKVLRFPNKAGTMIFAPKSNPGPTKPNPFLWQALVDSVH